MDRTKISLTFYLTFYLISEPELGTTSVTACCYWYLTWCLASFLSALTMLGMPAEIYTQGTQLLAVLFFIPVISFVTGEVYMPLFHNLQLDSSYQYLEMRFNKTVSNDKTYSGKYYAHAFPTPSPWPKTWSLTISLFPGICHYFSTVGGW